MSKDTEGQAKWDNQRLDLKCVSTAEMTAFLLSK